MEYNIILDSGDFFTFLIEKSLLVYNTRRMIQKETEYSRTLLTRTVSVPLDLN